MSDQVLDVDETVASRATYSLKELARLLGVSYHTAYELARRDKLPVATLRVGRQYLFPKSAVNRALKIDGTPHPRVSR